MFTLPSRLRLVPLDLVVHNIALSKGELLEDTNIFHPAAEIASPDLPTNTEQLREPFVSFLQSSLHGILAVTPQCIRSDRGESVD